MLVTGEETCNNTTNNPEPPEIANIPPTRPEAKPGLSAILRAMNPDKIGMISANALLLPMFQSCSANALYSSFLD